MSPHFLNRTPVYFDFSTSQETLQDGNDSLLVFEKISLILIILISVTWNSVALVAILKTKSLRTNIHTLYIINLCVADLGTSGVSMSFTIFDLFIEDYLIRSPSLCKINGFFVTIFPAVNVQTVSLIAVHRYLLATQPNRLIVTSQRAILSILSVWVMAISLAILPLTEVLSSISYSNELHHCCPNFRNPCLYGYLCLTAYIVTIPVTVFCYYSIWKTLSNLSKTLNKESRRNRWNDLFADDDTVQSKDISLDDDGSVTQSAMITSFVSSNPDQTNRKKKKTKRKIALRKLAADKRVAISSGLIIATTVVCWTPFAMTNVCFFRGHLTHAKSVFVLWLSYINSALDPIIYVYFNRNALQSLKQLLPCQVDNRRYNVCGNNGKPAVACSSNKVSQKS
ncbi:Octopamine receptor beta-2R [Holothuria leucospilota]|uniref:Octopamine receptor beta-2R n=1 Tax=Holothuria leucospilota TaxID=206669 RepID=A0A9Q1BUZ1_HOLLE|nr:Octopamine receptor beta-2R [Holothuria leucospilota]